MTSHIQPVIASRGGPQPSASALRWGFVVCLGLLLGASFGLNFGVSNQLYYLLPALKQLHPELLQRDWVASSSHNYHPGYAWLAVWLMKFDPQGWLMASLSVATIATGAVLCAQLARALAPRHWVLSALLVLTLAMATRTAGPGATSVFTGIFQPSSLGALGFLAAGVLWVKGCPLGAGISLAAAGAFHANYLVLSLMTYGLAAGVSMFPHGFRSPERGERWSWLVDTASVVVPPLLTLAWLFPLIWATAHSPHGDLVNRIYQDVRGPHHYDVARFWPTLLPWLGWQALGMGSLWDRRKEWGAPGLRLLILLGVITLLVASCVFFSTLVRIRSINHLFAWRIAPIGALLAQVAFVASGVAGPNWRARSRMGFGLQLAGVVALGWNAHFNKGMLVFLLVSACCVLWDARTWLRGRLAHGHSTYAAALALFAFATLPNLHKIPQRSSLLGEPSPGVGALCQWVRERTDVNSMFLIPPDFAEFRFWCQRAIVIDWKADPLVPEDFLVWVRRMEDVTGRAPLSGEADMQGYADLDAERARRLAALYAVDYVVTRAHKGDGLQSEPLFRSAHYEVYSVPPVTVR